MLFATPPLEPLDDEIIERTLAIRRDLRHSLAVRPRWTGVLRRMTMATAIASSNSIEGYHVTSDNALAAVDHLAAVEDHQDAEAWAATLSYRRAMTFVLQQHDDPHFTHSVDTIRGLHFMLVEHDLETLPGRWRPGPVFVHDTGSGHVVHEGPPADQVPDLMDEFVEQLGDEDGPAMVRAAMAHLNFVMVHPHKDGNGRLARVIQSLVLAREGMLSPEFCSIEEYLGRFTRDYHDVLAQVGGGRWQPERDAGPWVRFCLTAHHRQARVLLRRITEMGRLWEYLDGRIAQAELPERVAEALFLAAWGYRVTNEAYRARADVAAGTASRDLRHLVDAGLFQPHGEKRGRHYTATSDLLEQAGRVTASLRQEYRVDPYLDEELMADPYRQMDLTSGQ